MKALLSISNHILIFEQHQTLFSLTRMADLPSLGNPKNFGVASSMFSWSPLPQSNIIILNEKGLL